jgi:hypothetical protein
LWGGVLRAQELYCYYPSLLSVKERTLALKDDGALAGMSIEVFSIFRDQQMLMEQKQPELVIAPGLFTEFYTDYKPIAYMTYEHKVATPYLLLCLNPHASIEDITKKRLGIIDEVGRGNSNEFVYKILGLKPAKVRRVSKTQDLIPLLLLGNADFVLMRQHLFEQAKQDYDTMIYVVGESKPIRQPVLASLRPQDFKHVRLNKETVRSLGFDSYEEVSHD